jgi:hypothetical protein
MKSYNYFYGLEVSIWPSLRMGAYSVARELPFRWLRENQAMTKAFRLSVLVFLSIAARTAVADGYMKLVRGTDTISLNQSMPVGSSYTYEARLRFYGLPNPRIGVARDEARLFSEQNGSETDKAFNFDVSTGVVRVGLGQCCGAPFHSTDVPQLSDGGWHHLAVVRSPSSFRCYVDGVLVAEQESYGQPGPGAGSNRSSGAFRYALTGDNPTVQSVIADIDWLRISSSSRYQGASAVPPCEGSIVSDESTLALFRFNAAPANGSITAEGVLGVVGTVGVGFSGATSPDFVVASDADCNGDGVSDYGQIQCGELIDLDGNGVPDICETSISSVLPPSVPSQGGSVITIRGSNFQANPVVLVGGVSATDIVRVSQTQINATSPALPPGMASVKVNDFTLEDALYIRPECGSDLDQDGEVTASDIAIVLLDFGPCYSNAANTQPQDSTPFLLKEVR